MNPYDILARGLFQLLGLSPEDIKRQQAENYRRKENQKPIKVKGQTSTTSKSGKTRNFKNPSQSATRPPSLDPVQSRSTQQATPPRRPSGGFGQSPGQLSIPEVTGGNNPNARPSGRYQAPRVGVPIQGAAGPDIPERPNPYRATGPTRPGTGFTKATPAAASKLRVGGLTNALLNPFSTFNIITSLATNLKGDTASFDREPTAAQIKAGDEFMRKNKLGKYAPDYVAPIPYSGMADMSGDPILPQSKGGKGGKPQGRRNGSRPQGGGSGSRPQQIPVDNFDYGPNPYDLNGQPQAIPATPTLPSAPDDYSKMSEMERLKIWAITHRQMIENAGTKRQRNILNQALGMAKDNLKADPSQARAMSKM